MTIFRTFVNRIGVIFNSAKTDTLYAEDVNQMTGAINALENSSGNYWKKSGNAGTNPATDGLGTTDSQPLIFKTNNTERLRVFSNGNIGIGTNTLSSYGLDVNVSTIFRSSVKMLLASGSYFTIDTNSPGNTGFYYEATTGKTNANVFESKGFSTGTDGVVRINGALSQYVMQYGNSYFMGWQQPFKLLRTYPGLGSNNVTLELDTDGNAIPSNLSTYRILSGKINAVEKYKVDGNGAIYISALKKFSSSDDIVSTDGAFKPSSLADSVATNNSVYYSTTQNKLVYKDSSGTVNNLY